MKKCLLYLLLAAVLFPVATFAEEEEEEGMTIEDAERQLEMTNIRLDQKRAELEFDFEQKKRELKLQEAQLKLQEAHLKIDRAEAQFKGHGRHKPEGVIFIVMLIGLLTRILAPIWIYKDMRKRDSVSVMLVLFGILGGLFGLLVYAVVRLGDVKTATRTTRK
jgi:hypothetical protein